MSVESIPLSMKVAVLIVVVLAAFGLYVHQRTGKVSAASLERLVDKVSLSFAPNHHSCRPDPQKKWDYLCTGNHGAVSGFKVNRTQITGSKLIRQMDGTPVSGG